jgi:hypothetical protein
MGPNHTPEPTTVSLYPMDLKTSKITKTNLGNCYVIGIKDGEIERSN